MTAGDLDISNMSLGSNAKNDLDYHWNSYSSNGTSNRTDIFKQCLASYNDPPCRDLFIGIAALQIVIFVLGSSLNTVIICSFYRKPFLRKKIPNILLFNQAVADLVNMMIYLLTKLIHLLYQISTNHMIVSFQKLNIAFLYLSVVSSVLLFAVISIERFLSIFMPLWHRIHIQRHHLWYTVLSAWVIVTLMTTAIIATMFHESTSEKWEKFEDLVKYNFALGVIVVFMMFMITIVFSLNFFQALKSLRSQSIQTTSDQIRSKKQFRLTLIFLMMFIVFVLTFIPGVYAAQTKLCYSHSHSLFNVCNQTFICTFILTSIYNPILTLCLKREFRWQSTADITRSSTYITRDSILSCGQSKKDSVIQNATHPSHSLQSEGPDRDLQSKNENTSVPFNPELILSETEFSACNFQQVTVEVTRL